MKKSTLMTSRHKVTPLKTTLVVFLLVLAPVAVYSQINSNGSNDGNRTSPGTGSAIDATPQKDTSATTRKQFPDMTAGDCTDLSSHASNYAVSEYSARQRFCSERLGTTAHTPGVPATPAQADSTAPSTSTGTTSNDTRFGTNDNVAPSPADTTQPATSTNPSPGSSAMQEPGNSITGQPHTGDAGSMNNK